MAAWSGDHKKFDRKWLAAASEAEQRQLITNMDPESGWNAMHHAAVGGREKMLNTMLDACPDLVEVPNRQGWRPLHFAAGFGKAAVIDLLIERGASLQTRNELSTEYRGWTPLHRAFRWWLDPNKPNAILHLLTIGADPTALDASGRTPVDLTSDPCCKAAVAALADAAAAGQAAACLSRQSPAMLQRLRAALTATVGEEEAAASLARHRLE